MIDQIFFISSAYLIGSLSFGIIVTKVFNLSDPRTTGSKNNQRLQSTRDIANARRHAAKVPLRHISQPHIKKNASAHTKVH